MITGAIIGAGTWVTISMIALMNLPKGATLSITGAAFRAALFTGFSAFWGWVFS